MTTLISLIGKGSRSEDGGYRLANYRFDGDFIRTVPYFGLALAEYLKPQRLILAGTAGSMWDVFLQQHAADDDTVLQLMDAVENNAVSQSLLSACEAHLSQQLGLPVTCLLIPFARNEEEQASILLNLADVLSAREPVVIDVTHGFRHLPMLALVAARYLTRVRQVKIEELYYGALEMTAQNETPVLRLGSLLQMLDWVESLATYEKDGDYGVFAPLLERDGMPHEKAVLLQKAAFFERTGNPVRAAETLRSVFEAISQHMGALGGLFRDSLTQRVSWFRKNGRSAWEQSLSDAYLERGDYLRAATYLYESVITRATVDSGCDPNNFADRKAAYEPFRNESSRDLEFLRNSMAHGIRPMGKRSAQHLQSQAALSSKLSELRKELGS